MKNFKFLRVVYWILLIGIPAWLFISYLYKHESYPALVNEGVASLDTYNILSGEVIPLEGEWEFYPDEILGPGDDFSKKERIFLQVPLFWEKTEELPRYGCGTYRCVVNTRNTPNYLALYYNGIFTSSAIYINGLLYDVQGQAGETKSSTFPELKTQVVPFPSSGNRTEIIIPVSNFYFRSGGIQGEILFGEEHAVSNLIDQRLYIKAFLIGGLIIIAFFQLGMAVLPRFNRMYYLFAATCALLAFRLLVVRESPLYAIQDIPYEVKLRLEYLTLFIGIPMISAILNALFPKDFHRGFVFVFGGLGVLFSVAQYFVDILTASWMVPIYQVIVFIQGLIVTVILVVVVLRKRPDSYVFFIGWMMVLAGLVHDIMETSGFLHHDIQITPYLMFLFVFAQANVVALRSAKAFIQVEDLSDRLNFVNLNLEKLVSERTRRIEKQSMEMERQSRKIDRQNKELHKTVEIRNQVLTIIGHDLRGPIGNIGEMIDLLLSADIDGETQEQVLVAMRQAATGSFTLLENLM